MKKRKLGPEWFEKIGRKGGQNPGGAFSYDSTGELARRAAHNSWTPEARKLREQNRLKKKLDSHTA